MASEKSPFSVRPGHPAGETDPEAAEVEALLARLPLVSPGASLDRRVSTALITRRVSPASRLERIRPALLAAAAVVAVAAGVAPAVLRPADRRAIGQNPGASHPGPVEAHGSPGGPVQDLVRTAEWLDRDQPVGPAAYAPQAHVPSLALGEPSADDASTYAAHPFGSALPVRLEQTFERVKDDGVVLVEGGSAYTRLRRQAVRQIVVIDPATGRQVSVSIPTVEVQVRKLESY